jgi:hypothetical protein
MAAEKRNKPDKGKKNAETEHEDAPVTETSLEELEEMRSGYEQDLAEEYRVDTQHTEGSTHDPTKAQEQGLVYTPPTDPPVMPSDDLQGAEVATGFSPSMEESDPDVEVLPESVDDNDLDLADDIREALRVNSETSHLANVHVRVREGIVYLTGTVLSNEDVTIVDEIVRDLEGVVDIRNHLQAAA